MLRNVSGGFIHLTVMTKYIFILFYRGCAYYKHHCTDEQVINFHTKKEKKIIKLMKRL